MEMRGECLLLIESKCSEDAQRPWLGSQILFKDAAFRFWQFQLMFTLSEHSASRSGASCRNRSLLVNLPWFFMEKAQETPEPGIAVL